MSADLPPYHEYRDSGVPSLGEVPEHWGVRRVKTVFREKDGRSGDGTGVLLSLTRAGGIVAQADASNRIASVENLSKYKVCRPGDLVMNRMQAWSGMFAVSPREGLVSPDYSVFEASGISEVKYFEYLFKTPILVDEFARRSKGIGSGFNRLYTPDFGAVPINVPPLDEQVLIVRFIDRADRLIRRYIAARKKLIALLEEQKQAIIRRAVTRGLDPNVRLKASGVDWLGEVPEHWTVEPLKLHVAFQEGPGIMAADFRDQGVPLLRISCLSGEVATLAGCNYLDPDMVARKWRQHEVKSGDYLLSASGSLGSVSRVTDTVAGAIPYTGILRLWPHDNSKVSMEYVRHFMASEIFAAQIRFMKSGVGIEHFGPTHLKRMLILLPPVPEQSEIVAALNDQTASSRRTVQVAKREIDLLREYRIRLVAEVVTGKLDVRDAAASLPDEVDDLQPLDDASAPADDNESADSSDLEVASEEASV